MARCVAAASLNCACDAILALQHATTKHTAGIREASSPKCALGSALATCAARPLWLCACNRSVTFLVHTSGTAQTELLIGPACQAVKSASYSS